jgi:hypothetical protein
MPDGRDLSLAKYAVALQDDGVVYQVQEVGLLDWDSGIVPPHSLPRPQQGEAGIILNENIQRG